MNNILLINKTVGRATFPIGYLPDSNDNNNNLNILANIVEQSFNYTDVAKADNIVYAHKGDEVAAFVLIRIKSLVD